MVKDGFPCLREKKNGQFERIGHFFLGYDHIRLHTFTQG